MTIIVANLTAIASDSGGSANGCIQDYGTKVFQIGEGEGKALLGFSGDYLADRWIRTQVGTSIASRADVEALLDSYMEFVRHRGRLKEGRANTSCLQGRAFSV